MLGKTDVNVVAWAGDGGTYDIGIQALSGAAERNDDIIYVCYDNEAYMNTGIQRSGATPLKAWTTTTPVKHPEDRPKKRLVEIMAAHRIPYIATVSIAYPEDMVRKFKKAKEIKGTRFILVISPCPPGWKTRPEDTIKLARLAVQTRVFPLLEIYNGLEWKLTMDVKKPVPVLEYLKLQLRGAFLRRENLRLVFLELRRHVALGVFEGLLADVVRRHPARVRVTHLDVIPENPVVADFKSVNPSSFYFVLLVPGYPFPAVAADGAQPVELLVVPLADKSPFVCLGGRSVHYCRRHEFSHIVQHVEVSGEPPGELARKTA